MRGWLIAAALVCVASAAPACPRDACLIRTGVVGERDERLQHSHAPQSNPTLTRHLQRALRISFPLRGALATSGLPLCYPDVVLTVAHVLQLHGDATASARGLRVSVPDLHNPGSFSTVRTVADFSHADRKRRFDPGRPILPRDDFLLLQLSKPLPGDLEPVALPPLQSVAGAQRPHCDRATVNAAYHATLGFAAGRVRSATGPIRVGNAGRVPLVTSATSQPAKNEDPARFGEWYRDPLVQLTSHDIESSASGSGIICPTPTVLGRRARDELHGLVIGETVARVAGIDQSRNVIGVNLIGVYRSLAALRNTTVERIEAECRRTD